MSTDALPAGSEWLVTNRKAAYCAHRRLNGAQRTAQDVDDMIQAATLTYWRHQQGGRSVPFCFVCAHLAAEKYFYCRIPGRRPRHHLSLEAPLHDGCNPPHE